MDKYMPTGNSMLALPKINQCSAAVEDLTFLHMGHKGQVELRGSDKMPLILPFVEGLDMPSQIHWHREQCWIPVRETYGTQYSMKLKIVCPVGEKGFIIRMELEALKDVSFSWGLSGCLGSVWHCVNEDKPFDGKAYCYESPWNNSIIMDYRMGGAFFSLAPMCDAPCHTEYAMQNGQISYEISRDEALKAGERAVLTIFWGLGYEEVAAATSAKELLRRGYQWEYEKTCRWLSRRILPMKTDALTKLYNTNLFFCIFYSTGVTLDTEELVCVTSRSPRYYVSAAYWDRDTLLWTFPAILDADGELAREILHYVFCRQRRNFGTHSRYIDGTVLEPGFELDELVAPVIALYSYVKMTGDTAVLAEREFTDGIRDILKKLEACRHETEELYETFLQPSDDEIVHPYITYDNVLVWKMLKNLAELWPEKYAYCGPAADRLKKAIYDHCVFKNGDGKYFAWSVDLKGGHNVYDEPPGSLQLLPYYGFCSVDDVVWQATVKLIRSADYEYSFADAPIAEIGCSHAPYPWILSVANSLLCGHASQALEEIPLLKMDNGIACESVNQYTGECETGAAFATCAGFLCHCLKIAASEVPDAKWYNSH